MGGDRQALQCQVTPPRRFFFLNFIGGLVLTSVFYSPKEDVVVLGVHDLKRTSVQTLLVDEVFSPVNDAGFPPHSDLSLLRLSAAARFGTDRSDPTDGLNQVCDALFCCRSTGVSGLHPRGRRGARRQLDLHRCWLGERQDVR